MNRAQSKSLDRMEQPSRDVRRFDVPGGLLLLDQAANTLFAYNDVALCIWDLIEAGRSEAEIVAAVAGRWRIATSLAQEDIRVIVALWRTQGLLTGTDARPPHGPTASASAVPALSFEPPAQWTCTIRGIPIAFAVDAELLAPVRALFSHLETPGVPPHVRMTIARTPSGELALVEDGRERLRTDEPTLVVGALYVAVLERIRPGLHWFALMHGAALARNGQGLALVGSSGAGKSTLAAGLIGAGFDYLADDLVALSAPDGAIEPWPLPLSVKAGSLEVLLAQYPELAQAPRYLSKGLDARLLVPAADVWDAEPVRLRTLLFPRFAASAPPALRRLSTFQALERLLTDRVWLGDPITEDRVTSFLAWLDGTPAYDVSYGTLVDAMRLIKSVVP